MREGAANLCILTSHTSTAGASGDDVDHRTLLPQSWGSSKPFCSPTSKVEIEQKMVCSGMDVPSTISCCLWGSRAAASRPVLAQNSAQHAGFWKTDDFCNPRAGVWPTPSVPSIKTHHLKQGTTESGFVSQKPPVAASFSINESP